MIADVGAAERRTISQIEASLAWLHGSSAQLRNISHHGVSQWRAVLELDEIQTTSMAVIAQHKTRADGQARARSLRS
ncbi:hypothetical protein [Streptomyces roseochromogenus]|uniref:hypothetical protein n=1 Tax=Streptomyces roseochromogenus TaxID=285450 RepID=UPI000A97A7CE|nr:hypothetical protein [Streptomyces roseochromogenus]